MSGMNTAENLHSTQVAGDGAEEGADIVSLKDAQGAKQGPSEAELRALLERIAKDLGAFGLDMAEIAGAIEVIASRSSEDMNAFEELTGVLARVEGSNDQIVQGVGEARAVSQRMTEALTRSQGDAQEAIESINSLIDDVKAFGAQMQQVHEALESVGEVTSMIDSIARQTNLLALNATIEAARAGEAGKGFAIVASEVKQLAHHTSDATNEIDSTLDKIKQGFAALNERSQGTINKAETVGDKAGSFTTILQTVGGAISEIDSSTATIEAQSGEVQSACASFSETFRKMADDMASAVQVLCDASGNLRSIADTTDELVLGVPMAGLETPDSKFISLAIEHGKQIGELFDKSLEAGDITRDALFDREYRPIEGTNPQQVMTRFTEFTDRVLTPIQEALLKEDERIVYCAAVDENGYLPTHNLKFSKPQGDDPVWNIANCRNRRIFDDRVGLRAARNEKPVLLQTYRRDMGGGTFVVMKEVDVPIMADGRRWGTFRLAYKL